MVVSGLRRVLPGIALLLGIGLVARLVAAPIPNVSPLILAIVIGMGVANTIGVPEWAEAGVQTHGLWLASGIVIMGASLTLESVLEAGLLLVTLVVGTILVTLVLIELLARVFFGVSDELSSLTAAGASICGVSAIVAVAGTIKANAKNIAYAVGTILVFDVVTLFSYPVIGAVLDLADQIYGIWVGLVMFSTGPVTAAGFAYSDVAGQWATLTKLTRNALLGVAVLIYSIYYARQQMNGAQQQSYGRVLWTNFPKFVLGFLAMMVIASLDVLSDAQLEHMENAYQWLFLLAFAGLGTGIDIQEMYQAGMKPLVVVLVSLITMSIAALLVLTALF